MNNEQRLIAKIVDEGSLRECVNRGVNRRWFYDPDCREAWDFIVDHHEKYGNVPSRTTIKHEFGGRIKVVAISEPFSYFLDTLARFGRWQHGKITVEDAADALSADDPDGAVTALEEGLQNIRQFSPVSTHLVDSMDYDRLEERWDEYDKRKTTTGLIGLSTGFPTIDKATLGLQKGQLITVLAQHKVGKTSICLAIANHVYVEHKVPILFVTFEMGINELEIRQEALMAKVNFKRLQAGDLAPIEEKKYADWLDYAQDHYDWPFHFMDISAGGTVSAVEAMIVQHEPALVIVDGIYMMTDEITGERNSWEAITNITRSMKRMAAQQQVPIIINSQALRSKSKGETISSDSAGYSSSFGQDSDVVLGVERIPPAKGEPETAHEYERLLRVLAARNVGLSQVELLFDYDEGRIEEV